MTDLPKYKANTVWWNSSSMYIRCPHCDKIHRHGFGGDYHVKHHRAPHCEGRESYTMCFPSDGLYEIDRSRGLYVRAGADPAAFFAQFDPAPKVDVSDRHKWTEAQEEIELDGLGFGPIRGNRLELTVSDMIMGRLQTVRSYLETSQEKDIFLHGVQAFTYRHPIIDEGDTSQNILKDDQDGNNEATPTEIERTTTSGETVLHMAACEMYPELVDLLLDFAADTRENSEERYDRSGGKHQVYKDVTHERNQDRTAIVRELSDEAGEGESRNTATFSHLNGFGTGSQISGAGKWSRIVNAC
ncbi:hypothetical protein FOPG_18491 [Fusarium oxysporum f. sp. conglutinans race 2 54008]|uniref:Uncharacterized protein n=2 Tax=Fusarium oxysporum f. sp. conglutinans TaxID=100902 RepID=A0A8H6H1F4_FUSOX|nr:hypothetical protein FOPG_18491 [Fusarium oxysporum f. sp. conglutinans race 2 54008]KAF6527571.1 hypothetical protein HZS61_007873 [Fusarium oxysporum f. sp. conglutinans]KAG7000128.1 hypothetical protein FocnCong_v013427 [Fusarium oxysporum f. sp. conglutinans]KAI8417318.1 hypothetical protein FOFC_03631 [Fusarium oxysporum]